MEIGRPTTGKGVLILGQNAKSDPGTAVTRSQGSATRSIPSEMCVPSPPFIPFCLLLTPPPAGTITAGDDIRIAHTGDFDEAAQVAANRSESAFFYSRATTGCRGYPPGINSTLVGEGRGQGIATCAAAVRIGRRCR